MQEWGRSGSGDRERLEESSILLLYIPVIHKGYIDLLKKYSGQVETLYLLGEDILESLEAPKEIRAVNSETIKDLLTSFGLSFNVEVLHLDTVEQVSPQEIVTTQDPVVEKLRERYFPDASVKKETVFLRWNENNVTSPLPPHFDEETEDSFHLQMMKRAKELSDNSSDWWRQVGVVIVRDGMVLVEAYNKALISENQPYIEGNPRDFIKAGTLGFLGNTVHAEQLAIAKARGISLEGADLYLNSYPCSPCAELIGQAGIKRCFFSGGNAYLNVEEVLKKWGIKTIFVREELPNREING